MVLGRTERRVTEVSETVIETLVGYLVDYLVETLDLTPVHLIRMCPCPYERVPRSPDLRPLSRPSETPKPKTVPPFVGSYFNLFIFGLFLCRGFRYVIFVVALESSSLEVQY